jgi:hypothetical protein
MSFEEDYLMAEVAKLKDRVNALEAIVTHPHGAVSGQDQPPVPEPETASDGYDALTVEQLRAELKNRGLPTSGNKAELVERLLDDDTASE